MSLSRVTFYDLSGYAENVVFASNAPIETSFVCPTDEAWEYLFAFSDDYQVSIEALPEPDRVAVPQPKAAA